LAEGKFGKDGRLVKLLNVGKWGRLGSVERLGRFSLLKYDESLGI